MDRAAVFIITGAMAAGKSTVAELLARDFPKAAHIRGDVFRRMVASGRAEMTPGATEEAEEQLRLRHRLAAGTASAYFEAGFTVVVQDAILGEHLSKMRSRLRGEPVFAVALRPCSEVLLEREAARDKYGYDDTRSVRELDEVLAATPGVDLWVDSSEQTVSEVPRRTVSKKGK